MAVSMMFFQPFRQLGSSTLSCCLGAFGLCVGFPAVYNGVQARRLKHRTLRDLAVTGLERLKDDPTFCEKFGMWQTPNWDVNSSHVSMKKIRVSPNGTQCTVMLILRNKKSHALVSVAAHFVPSSLRAAADKADYEDLLHYQKFGTLSDVFRKPHVIKLALKSRVQQVWTATFGVLRQPYNENDTSHWEVKGICVAVQPLPSGFWRLRRVIKLLLRGADAVAKADRQETVVFSVLGSVRDHVGFGTSKRRPIDIERFLDPLQMRLSKTSQLIWMVVSRTLTLGFLYCVVWKRLKQWSHLPTATTDVGIPRGWYRAVADNTKSKVRVEDI